MKKIIIGFLMLKFSVLEPIIGYFILKWLEISSESVEISMVFAYLFVFIAQLVFYVSLIMNGYKELKIKTPFED